MRGICFKEPLFLATIESRKTETRRIMNPQPDHFVPSPSPRYYIGEVLYLKEPYAVVEPGSRFARDGVPAGTTLYKYNFQNHAIKWKNKLFMPADLARYFIRITDVRAERLQQISDEDCVKEGIYLDVIERNYFHYHDPENRHYCEDCEDQGRERLIKDALDNRTEFGFDSEYITDKWVKEELDNYSMDDYSETAKTCDICGKMLSGYRYSNEGAVFYDPAEAYAALTDKINGRGTWDSNPIVCVYDYVLCDRFENMILKN